MYSPLDVGLNNSSSGLFSGINEVSEQFRQGTLDAADSLTGTGKYRSSSSSSHPAPPAYAQSASMPEHGMQGQIPSEHAGARSITTTSGPGAGIGGGGNPMRASGLTDEDAATVAEIQRGAGQHGERHAVPDASHTGNVDGTSVGAGSVGPQVASGAPAGPGMVGGAVV
jgi:hypothetical protein